MFVVIFSANLSQAHKSVIQVPVTKQFSKNTATFRLIEMIRPSARVSFLDITVKFFESDMCLCFDYVLTNAYSSTNI